MSSDDARQTAFNPSAPASERYDANAELGKAHNPLASMLLPNDAVRETIAWIEGQYEESLILKAAGGANVIQFPGRVRDAPKRGMQSVYLDDLQIMASGEFYEKAAPLGFEQLRAMVEGTPILNSIVLTRLRQLARFCQMSEDNGPGFEIRHSDRKHELTGAEDDAARLLGKFFANCGWEFNPRRRKALKRDNFKQFMMRSYRDSLTMDAQPIETEMKRDRSLGIDGFYALDGATIRLCTEDGYAGDDQIYALQVIQGRLATAYTLDTLIYEVRNPRTDVRMGGYGMGETELLIRVVTGFLNAMTYNITGFDQNAIPKGLLHLSGNYNNEELSSFKRYWNSAVKGVNNRWTLPVMVSKDQESKASFEPFNVEFNDMHFAKWMTFLVSIACSIYGMSPEEINFESFAAQKSSLSGSDTTEKLASSKDSGLFPDMAHMEAMLTDFIVVEFDENFCFRWVGLKEEDAEWKKEAKKLVLTVDELRAEEGYEKSANGMGDAPLNPTLVGIWAQAQQQPEQGEQQDFGQPGDDDGEDDPAMGNSPGPPGQDASGEQDAPEPADDGGGEFGAGGGSELGKAFIFKVEG